MSSETTLRQPSPGEVSEPIQLSLRPWVILSVVLLIAGIVGFLIALAAGFQQRAWEAFLVNLLFWLSIAQGGIVVSSAFYMTQGRWAGSAQYRLAEMFFLFLPVGFLLFWVLLAGRTFIFPWILHPIPAKSFWLNWPFLFARDGFALLVMTLLSWWFVAASRRENARQWAASAHDIVLPPSTVRRLSPAIAMVFAVVYSLIAFDLVMSLSPVWRSTLFGAWFFATSFWAGIVAMAITAVLLQARYKSRIIFFKRDVLQDLGKMVFAFSIFWVYLLFAQYLVIWYGDIPVETFFVVIRLNYLPWSVLSWALFGLIWCTPFLVLMGRRPKRTPAILGIVALLGLIGVYIEQYVLVVPSLSPRVIPFGWVEILVTIGFLGLFALCSFPGLKRVLAASGTAERPGWQR